MLHPTLDLSLQGKETENSLDWDLSLAVLEHVDRKEIFPKLPAYNRQNRSVIR
jgi:hypothetical protein